MQNKLFRCNQKIMWKRKISPNAEEAKEFWSNLWDNPVPCKEDAEWLKEVDLELENVNIQKNVEIIKKNVTMQLTKMQN